jgi:hypothetical protein
MALATAYFDESLNGGMYVVAGFAATLERWQKFEADWVRLLKENGLTAFHAKDYAHSKGEFESWKGDEPRRQKFMKRAIAIISRRCMVAVGVAVDRDAFRKTIAQDEVVSQFYVNEYTTASFMSLLVTNKWAGCCTFDGPVNYVFDRGNCQRKDFERAYDLALMIPSERTALGVLSFGDDQVIPALQAADLIAYECCKVLTDLKMGKKRFRASMQALLKMRCDIKVPTEEALAKLVAKMKSIPEETDV